jgi:hypothetical protein
MTEPLFLGMFDDAAMFPPAKIAVDRAVAGHARHRLSWYEEFVGPLVSLETRLLWVDELAARLGLLTVDVALVVPYGPDSVAEAVRVADKCEHIKLRGVEIGLRSEPLREALATGAGLADRGIPVYVEIPIPQVTERHVHRLREAGLFLKLRTGGTTIDAFSTEAELARPIVFCAAERLKFKCTAGLHNAVRHRDSETLFEHHGFLNITLATLTAAGTGSVATVRDVLSERDPSALAAQAHALTAADVKVIRSLFGSFGTCSVTEPIDDLIAMGLVKAA